MALIPLIVRPDQSEAGAASVYIIGSVADRPYEFLLDTGAARSRLPLDEHTRTLAAASNRVSTRGALGEGTGSRLVVAPVIEVGPIRARNVVVDLADEAYSGPPAILGLDVLADHRIDVVSAATACVIDGARPVDAERMLVLSSHKHPHVTVDFPGVSALAVWDTGASVSVVDQGFATRYPELLRALHASVGTDANGNQESTSMVSMVACSIGGRVFPPSLAAVASIRGIQPPGDPEFDLLLGYPIISRADWSIDFRKPSWGYGLDTRRPVAQVLSALEPRDLG